MVFITHNTDIGDAFEREGDSRAYFVEFSVEGYALGDQRAALRDVTLSRESEVSARPRADVVFDLAVADVNGAVGVARRRRLRA